MKDDKSTSNDSESNDVTNKVEIFSTSDDKLKFLGEMFSNDSSRKILSLLIEKELTASEISQKTELSLSLVIHHLNKMIDAGIVNITRTSQNSKGHEMKHYRAKSAILIFPAEASEKAKKSKTLSNSLKRIMKFSVIGIAGLISWIVTKPMETEIFELPEGEEFPEPIVQVDYSLSIAITLGIIIIGLIIERILTHYKNRTKI